MRIRELGMRQQDELRDVMSVRVIYEVVVGYAQSVWQCMGLRDVQHSFDDHYHLRNLQAVSKALNEQDTKNKAYVLQTYHHKFDFLCFRSVT